MQFEKDVKFIGMSEPNQLSDGGAYYTVTMFEPQAGISVVVNVMDTEGNKALLEALDLCDFGDLLHAAFELRPKDKLYRLRLLRV